MTGSLAFLPPGHDAGLGPSRPVHIIQGQHRVSGDPAMVITTILGSCVAACIRDPGAGVGGMNHFLLPGTPDRSRPDEVERYGVHAMELLVNALLALGARRSALEVKLFGGARMVRGLADIGAQNAAFATAFAKREGLKVVGECLGGTRGRRIQFWPVCGRARRIFLSANDRAIAPAVPLAAVASGSVELF